MTYMLFFWNIKISYFYSSYGHLKCFFDLVDLPRNSGNGRTAKLNGSKTVHSKSTKFKGSKHLWFYGNPSLPHFQPWPWPSHEMDPQVESVVWPPFTKKGWRGQPSYMTNSPSSTWNREELRTSYNRLCTKSKSWTDS